MLVTPYRTKKIMPGDNLEQVLEESLPKEIPEKSIVAVTSKIVSICEGRVVPVEGTDKDELIAQEADVYLPREENQYNISMTITRNILAPSAGIDASNGNGYYILWPQDPQKSVNAIREFLVARWHLDSVGVIITDSKTSPLRWGVTAIALGFSGLVPLKSYINQPDLFGRPFVFEQMSIIDNLACAAVLVMGEGAEQTPIAVIEDTSMVTFVNRNPTADELSTMQSNVDKDMYGTFFTSAPWKKGKGGK